MANTIGRHGVIGRAGGFMGGLFHALALPLTAVYHAHQRGRARKADLLARGCCTSCEAPGAIEDYGLCEHCLMELRAAP